MDKLGALFAKYEVYMVRASLLPTRVFTDCSTPQLFLKNQFLGRPTAHFPAEVLFVTIQLIHSQYSLQLSLTSDEDTTVPDPSWYLNQKELKAILVHLIP